MDRNTAVVIGSGLGGIACAIRLQSFGFNATVVAKLDAPDGRALVHKAEGYVFDMGGTGALLDAKVLASLETQGHIPNLRERIRYKKFVTPGYFENTLNTYAGNGFDVEPVMVQPAYFSPHNHSEDVKNLYRVSQGTQPLEVPLQ